MSDVFTFQQKKSLFIFMNNGLLFGIVLSALLIGSGSVYILMSSQKAQPSRRADAEQINQLQLLTEQVTSLNAKIDLLFEMQLISLTNPAKTSLLSKSKIDLNASQKVEESNLKSAAEKAACKDAASTIALVNLATGMGMTSPVEECE